MFVMTGRRMGGAFRGSDEPLRVVDRKEKNVRWVGKPYYQFKSVINDVIFLILHHYTDFSMYYNLFEIE